jgi:hypothetical protein
VVFILGKLFLSSWNKDENDDKKGKKKKKGKKG